MNIKNYFENLRFDEDFHLGLGDIRLIVGMQEEIEAEFSQIQSALKELHESAKIIYVVSDNSWRPQIGIVCPHGNGGYYPSSAHWCDECFERLNFALDNAERLGYSKLFESCKTCTTKEGCQFSVGDNDYCHEYKKEK